MKRDRHMIKDSNSANSVFIQSTFLIAIAAFHSAAIEAIGSRIYGTRERARRGAVRSLACETSPPLPGFERENVSLNERAGLKCHDATARHSSFPIRPFHSIPFRSDSSRSLKKSTCPAYRPSKFHRQFFPRLRLTYTYKL